MPTQITELPKEVKERIHHYASLFQIPMHKQTCYILTSKDTPPSTDGFYFCFMDTLQTVGEDLRFFAKELKWCDHLGYIAYPAFWLKKVEGAVVLTEEPNPWTSLTECRPEFDTLVIFRAVCKWSQRVKVKYFIDEVTTQTETLEYGHNCYLLRDNTDYLVLELKELQEMYDEHVTHWMPLPSPPNS